MKLFLTGVLFFLTISYLSSQNIPFSYQILSKKHINYKTLKPKESKRNLSKKEPDTLRILEIDNLIKLYIFDNRFNERTMEIIEDHRHYIEVLNRKYKIDSLVNPSYLKEDDPILMNPSNFYKFSFSGRNYIVLFIVNSSYSSSLPSPMAILFDITEINNVKLVLSKFQAAFNMDCFGDFNQDGYLDFAWRMPRGNELLCYTLKNGKFHLNDRYKLIIEGNAFEPTINLAKSQWFFKLK